MKKEELENLKLQSEIDKNKAEAKKAENEALIFQKQAEDNWYSGRSLKLIVGGLTTAFALWGIFKIIILPVVNLQDDTREWQIKKTEAENQYYVAEFKNIKKERDELDSLRVDLNNQVKAITARLDSTIKQQESELRLVAARLKEKEESKDQSNREEIKRLTAQVSKLSENIKNTKSEKEQIRTIVPVYLSEDDVTLMIRENGYYDRKRNPNGLGIENKFKLQRGNTVVYDAETGLTWQQSGSKRLTFEQAQAYIEQKNRENYAGFSDWRQPTLKEAMSLMSPDKKDGLYIDPLFDKTQYYIWTSDKVTASGAWDVSFGDGFCFGSRVGVSLFVRAVR